MQATTPQLDTKRIRVAEGQDGFNPITAAIVRHPAYPSPVVEGNTHVLAFKPNDDERTRITEGADIYVSLLTFGGAMQGIIVMAGKEEASAIYNVKATAEQDQQAGPETNP